MRTRGRRPPGGRWDATSRSSSPSCCPSARGYGSCCRASRRSSCRPPMPFARYTALLIPAFFGFAFIQYALNPVFQLRKETAPVVVAALVAVGGNGALLLVLPDLLGPAGVAVAQVAGFASATLVVAVLALRSHGAPLPWRDLALSVIATAAMALAVMPLRQLQPAGLALAASAALGILVYAI